MTRWNLSIPEQTDRTVRTFLARTGGKKGDLSRFVDEAVRRREAGGQCFFVPSWVSKFLVGSPVR